MLALALLVPAVAHASAWTALQDVSDLTHNTQQPPTKVQLGVDSAGDAFEVQLADKGPPNFVQLATRPAGSNWTTTQDIGTITTNTGTPALAVDPAGHALVVFVNTSNTAPCNNTASGCLHIVAVNPDGTHTETLYNNGGAAGNGMFEPAVALDPSGNGSAVIAWRATPSANNAMEAISGSFNGPWPAAAATQFGATTSTMSQPHVAIDGAGHVVATWLESVTGIFSVRSSLQRGATAWAAPQTRVSNAASGYSGLFEQTGAQGNIDVAWVGPSGTNTLVQAITWDSASSAFPAAGPDTLTTVPNTHSLVGPRVQTASDGEAVAVWMDDFTSTTSTRSVMAATRTGGAWGALVTLDPSTVDPSGPALAMDAGGNATAVWHNASLSNLRYAVHTHGGTFGGTFDGPAAPQPPVAAADSLGHVHAAWSKDNTAAGTAVFDPVAPGETLAPLSASLPLPGTAIDFAAAVSDLWSNPVSVHWDFGDNSSADGTTASHAYSAPGVFTAKAIATDTSGNTTAQTQTVTVAAPATGPQALPRPIAGKTVNLDPVSGTVLVKVPGSNSFVPLVTPTQVQNGSIIDARKGRVRITIDNGRGGFDTSDFYGGIFQFTQPKVKAGQTWFADLFLFGGSFKGCPGAPKNPKLASVSKKKANPKRSVRHLWGSGHGAFRTVGRFSSATIRGTTWLTDDRCDGTNTKVTSGKVGVRDFVLKKTIVVKKGTSYLAHPRAHSAKKR